MKLDVIPEKNCALLQLFVNLQFNGIMTSVEIKLCKMRGGIINLIWE